jgi:hypothetical protein
MQPCGRKVVRYGNPEAEFSIYALADLHLGNAGVDKVLLQQDIERIRHDPLALWLLAGDYCDWINPTDPRFDPEMVDPTIKVRDFAAIGAKLADIVKTLLEPIAPRCLGLGYGNHDWKYMTKAAQSNIHEELCRALHAPNFRWSAFFDVYFQYDKKASRRAVLEDRVPAPGARRLRVAVHHGFGWAQTDGGKLMALARFVGMVDADLVIMGHLHTQLAKAWVRLGADAACRKITQKPTMGLMTGTYLRAYPEDMTSYMEQRGYAPSVLGATRAMFKPNPNGRARLAVENVVEF